MPSNPRKILPKSFKNPFKNLQNRGSEGAWAPIAPKTPSRLISGSFLDPSWKHLGAPWGALGVTLGASKGRLEAIWAVLRAFGPSCGPPWGLGSATRDRSSLDFLWKSMFDQILMVFSKKNGSKFAPTSHQKSISTSKCDF